MPRIFKSPKDQPDPIAHPALDPELEDRRVAREPRSDLEAEELAERAVAAAAAEDDDRDADDSMEELDADDLRDMEGPDA